METSNEKVNWTFVTILAGLIVIVLCVFFGLLIIGGFLWLDSKEDWRGTEAWRQKQIYDERKTYQRKCELSVQRQRLLVKELEDAKRPVHGDLTIFEDCGAPAPLQQEQNK